MGMIVFVMSDDAHLCIIVSPVSKMFANTGSQNTKSVKDRKRFGGGVELNQQQVTSLTPIADAVVVVSIVVIISLIS